MLATKRGLNIQSQLTLPTKEAAKIRCCTVSACFAQPDYLMTHESMTQPGQRPPKNQSRGLHLQIQGHCIAFAHRTNHSRSCHHIVLAFSLIRDIRCNPSYKGQLQTPQVY